uniref:Uncharacterized protein n=1 Tax=Sinocyclocheilus anshuiensis TaxID=1608454 RepID=A0A671QF55_9TELE
MQAALPPFRMDPESLDLQQVPVLSIDQIRAIRANNDYVERPVALDPASQVAFYPHDERHPQMSRSQSQHQHSHLAHLSRSSTVSSMSRGSAASDQRLLAGLTPSHSGLAVVRSQPKGDLKPDSLGSGKFQINSMLTHLRKTTWRGHVQMLKQICNQKFFWVPQFLTIHCCQILCSGSVPLCQQLCSPDAKLQCDVNGVISPSSVSNNKRSFSHGPSERSKRRTHMNICFFCTYTLCRLNLNLNHFI